MPRGKRKCVESITKAPDVVSTRHRWQIGMDKYSFILEHWVEVPDEITGGKKFAQKSSDSQFFGSLDQLAKGMRDTAIRKYVDQGDRILAAIEKSTEDVMRIFRGERDFIEFVIKSDVTQNLIRAQAGEPEEQEEEEEEPEEDE